MFSDMAPLQQPADDGRPLAPPQQRRDESFTPDGQFFLLVSVGIIGIVLFLGLTVALYLRRGENKYNHYSDPPNPDKGVDHGDLRIWNCWGWVRTDFFIFPSAHDRP